MHKLLSEKMLRHKIFFLLTCLLLLCSAALAAPLPETALEAQPRPVRVGYFAYGSYHHQDVGGHRSGYGYDLLQLLNIYNDWNYEYVGYGTHGWNDMLNMLERGEIDLLTSAGKTPEREARFAFSELPIGRQRHLLVTRSGEQRFQGLEMNKYDGLKIAVIRGSRGEEAIRTFAAANGFTPQLLPVANQEEQLSLLNGGRADAALVSNLALPPQVRVLEIIKEEPIYIIVNKSNTALLRELNSSLQMIDEIYPNWQVSLTHTYFPGRLDEFLPLTAEDRAYLTGLRDSGKKLRVMVPSDAKPYAYKGPDGDMLGILPELFHKLAVSLYLPYEFCAAETPEEAEMLRDEADIILGVPKDPSNPNKSMFKLTREVINMPLARIVRDDFSGTEHNVAMPWHFQPLVTDDYVLSNGVRPVLYHSMEDCVKAVSGGRCDAAYLGLYTAQQFILRDESNSLRMFVMPDFQLSLSMAVNRRHSFHLAKLFNVALANLDTQERAAIEAKYVNPSPQKFSLADYLRSHVEILMGILLIAALLFISFLLYTLHLRQKNAQTALEYAFTDRRSGGLPNRHWFEVNTCQNAADAWQHTPDDSMYIAIIALNRAGILLQNFGRKFVANELARIMKSLRDDSSNVHSIALSSSGGRIFLLFSLPPGQTPDCWLDEQIKKYRHAVLKETDLHTEQQVILALKAGYTPMSRDELYSNAMHNKNSQRDYIVRLVGWAETAYNNIVHSQESVAAFQEYHLQLQHHQEWVEQHMANALLRHEIKLYCQPKYDIRTHKIIGAEALARWISPELGFLGPGQFIPIFEHNGFIMQFDFYMLENTCSLQRRRLDEGKPIVPVSVNMSRLQFSDPDYLKKIQDVAERYHLPQGAIELEITETVLGGFNSPAQIKGYLEILDALHRLGFGLSMDDFGSGYSSLQMLAQMPMDVIKIDRGLLLFAEQSEKRHTILAAAIDLGRHLNINVICEGIETVEQEQLLLSLGCNEGQGFLFAKPMPVDDFEKFMDEHL